MHPVTPVLFMLGGMFVIVIASMLVGWFLVPATERILKITSYTYFGAVLSMIVTATILVVSVVTGNGPDSAFNILPVCLTATQIALVFGVTGFMRGLSIQKHRRWV